MKNILLFVFLDILMAGCGNMQFPPGYVPQPIVMPQATYHPMVIPQTQRVTTSCISNTVNGTVFTNCN